VMRVWETDGIEMEDGCDFAVIVRSYLRKIAAGGVRTGGVSVDFIQWTSEISLLYPFCFFCFLPICLKTGK
jgi:hypothetical protein